MNIGLKTLREKFQEQSLIPDLNYNFDEIRRAFRKIDSNDVDTWQTYTPVLKGQVGDPSNVGIGWNARYKRSGTTGDLKIAMQVSAAMAATPGTGLYYWSLPSGWTITPGYEQTGSGTFLRPGVARYNALTVAQPTPTFSPGNILYLLATDNSAGFASTGPGRALAWVAGDFMVMDIRLELVAV